MEAKLKYNLLSFYLSQPDNSQIITSKELQDFCKEHDADLSLVKDLNYQLVQEGLIKTRNRPILYFQVAQDLQSSGKLKQFEDQIRQELQSIKSKNQKLKTKIDNEKDRRRDLEAIQQQLKQAVEQVEKLTIELQKCDQSTEESLISLDQKLNIAHAEVQKWTDNALLIVQSIVQYAQQTDPGFSINDVVEHLPYLKRFISDNALYQFQIV